MQTSLAYFWAGVAVAVLGGAFSINAAVAADGGVAAIVPGIAAQAPSEGGMDAAIAALRRFEWARAVDLYRPLVNASNSVARGQARYGLAVALSQLGHDKEALDALEGTLNDGTPLGKAVGVLRAELLLQLADKALAEQGPATANAYLDQYDRLPDQPERARYERIRGAGATVAGADAGHPSLTLRVGVMVPMTGPLKDVGMAILRGLQLGVHDFDGRRGTALQLLPVDVPDAAHTKAAAQQLATQGVDVVVGPLLSDSVGPANEVFGSLHVPVLALSNDRSVMGNGVYALNYLPAAQARLMARAAVSAGATRLAGLAPADTYGYDVFGAFQDEARRLGAQVSGSSFYDPHSSNIGQNIRSLVGTAPRDPSDTTIPFDALFVPTTATALPLVVAQLSYYDVDGSANNGKGVMLLGTTLWQNPSLLNPNVSGVRGALFATPPRTPDFNKEYSATFGAAPVPLAIVGYDAARVLDDVAAEKQRTGQDVQTLLLRPEGFYGSGGYLRFTRSGQTERGLDVVKIGQQFEVVQPGLRLAPPPMPRDLQPGGKAKGSGGWFW